MELIAATIARDLKSEYQRIANTIVQLPRFEASVLMY
jgi:hypothetical protein